MSKVLFWSGFGLAVRFWQLGIEMRPFFHKQTAWGYPLFGAIGAGVGFWLTGVQERQLKALTERRDALMDKRRRRAERNGETMDPSFERPVIAGFEQTGPSATVATAR